MSRQAKKQLPATPIEFPRADPAELAKFDPSTKVCTMNCGGHRDDPRDDVERKLLCGDCQAADPKPPALARGDIWSMCEQVGIDFQSHTGITGIERITTCGSQSISKIERLVALATERERSARQAAQVENEELKARLARAGIEQRKAVLEEREACANLAQQYAGQVGDVAWTIAGGIRARSRA